MIFTKSKQKINYKLILILLIALILRLYGINWDSGYHLHPDERMLIMVADRINFFSNLNPHFFNYGSLPIYLLKGTSQFLDVLLSSHYYASYEGLLYVGRSLSILFDLGTIFLIYKITRLLFSSIKDLGSRIYYLPSFFYAIAFFPIQNSHFFTVDTPFTFLSTFLIYTLLLYLKNHSYKNLFFIAIVFSALFATKFTGVIFLPIVLMILLFNNKISLYSILNTLYFILISLLFSFLFMPYTFLDFPKFWADISVQLAMSRDPYIFPYTLQYVGTAPYLYYLKNIFLWGLGPVISIVALLGMVIWLKKITIQPYSHYVFFLFYLFYFLVIGFSSVKFMRYMLPMYPFFAIFASFGLYKLYKRYKLLAIFFCLVAVLWTFLFLSIYSQPNTRVTATEWILKHVPAGSSLAVEYWDDYLPIYGGERYRLNELHLYDQPDDDIKWQRLNNQLQQSDYIVIASNRLSTPLQKLTDCTKYKMCYPKTAEYYQKLFNGKLGFKKIEEFSVYPGIADQSADESFTVFDHPKIIVFKRLK